MFSLQVIAVAFFDCIQRAICNLDLHITQFSLLFCHFSEAEPKGSDCYDQFATMQECFARYPTVYNKSGSAEEDDDFDKDIDETKNALRASQSNVDTVDQLEEMEKMDKTASAKSDNSVKTKDKQ